MSLYCGTLSTWMPHSPNSARKTIPCGMKMWHGYRHSFINHKIRLAYGALEPYLECARGNSIPSTIAACPGLIS